MDGLSGTETVFVDFTHLPSQILSRIKQRMKIIFYIVHSLLSEHFPCLVQEILMGERQHLPSRISWLRGRGHHAHLIADREMPSVTGMLPRCWELGGGAARTMGRALHSRPRSWGSVGGGSPARRENRVGLHLQPGLEGQGKAGPPAQTPPPRRAVAKEWRPWVDSRAGEGSPPQDKVADWMQR